MEKSDITMKVNTGEKSSIYTDSWEMVKPYLAHIKLWAAPLPFLRTKLIFYWKWFSKLNLTSSTWTPYDVKHSF